jgi:choline monooxygenase
MREQTMSDRLSAFLSADQRAAIREPIERARTFPREAFLSGDFFAMEGERIFGRSWAACALADQAPHAGDLVPLELCGVPLLLVRGTDDCIRVFHNVVPYDGCLAVVEPVRGAREIVAPYHGWRYDLGGRLVAAPWWNGTPEGAQTARSEHAVDLRQVSSETFGGVVFVDLSGQTGPFEDFIGPLERALAEYDLAAIEVGRTESGEPLLGEEDLATNWKTHYENWGINVLHESFVHEMYASSRDHSGEIPRVDAAGQKTYVDHIDGGLMALRFRAKDFQATYPTEMLPFAHLGKAAAPELGYFGSLFPNLHFGVLPGVIHWIVALPDGPSRTRTVRAQFYEASSAQSPDFLEARIGLRAGFEAAGSEDARITEAIQRARRSPACASGYYSPFWDQMHHAFSNHLLDALEAGS